MRHLTWNDDVRSQRHRAGSSAMLRCLIPTLSVLMAVSPVQSQVAAGTRAPEIDLRTLEGTSIRLSQLRGHPVIVTFWGTWCAPCREEFPQLVATYRTHHPAGLEILAVNQRDQETDDRAVREFGARYGAQFRIVVDPRGRLRRTYRLVGLPTTVFIDSAGTIALLVSGPLSTADHAKGLNLIMPAR